MKFSVTYCIAVIAILFSSCAGEQKKAAPPFEHYFNFEQEIKNLQQADPLVRKTITKNGASETITSKVNWKKELALFTNSNINNHALKDEYDVERNTEAETTVVAYKAKKEDQPVRLARFTYNGEKCTEAFFKRKITNPVYESWQELTYVPGASYTIETQQKLRYAIKTQLKITGKILPKENAQNKWRGVLDIGEATLPFNFIFNEKNNPITASIINAEEQILVEDITTRNDSIFIHLPVFNSEIKGQYIAGESIIGAWFNYSKGDYHIPFHAAANKPKRFVNSQPTAVPFSGRWEVTFSQGTEDEYKAIGEFHQLADKVTGTFLTETGDYRYLEGTTRNDSLLLSCFDGAHAFLFKAAIHSGDSLSGNFWSGKHWKEPWVARRSNNFKLTHPDSLTYLKDGYDQLTFSFPNLEGETVSLADERFKGKVVIVQIMGSWCPNCKDETAYLGEVYANHKQEGLEVVALAFEKSKEFEKAKAAVDRHKNDLQADYEFLIAGPASKKKAADALPMLNHIISFPTTVFIDRKGKIRRIYTGFYGPGTGEHYNRFVENTDSLIKKLLKE